MNQECRYCGSFHDTNELIRFGDLLVCTTCKPVVTQLIVEGAWDEPPADGGVPCPNCQETLPDTSRFAKEQVCASCAAVVEKVDSFEMFRVLILIAITIPFIISGLATYYLLAGSALADAVYCLINVFGIITVAAVAMKLLNVGIKFQMKTNQ